MSIRSTGTTTTGTGPARQMTNDDKQLESLLKREEKEEERHVQHALKDLKATEKANSKAHTVSTQHSSDEGRMWLTRGADDRQGRARA